MADHFDDEKHMMAPHRDHAGGRERNLELEPVGGEPQIPDWAPENFDCYAAAAEEAARAPLWMSYDPRIVSKSSLLAAPYGSDRARRIAHDNRCYRTACWTLGAGIVLLLGALWWLGPDGFRSAPAKVALDNSSWCSGFSGLSCAKDNARK